MKSTGTSGVYPKQYFQKKNSKYDILNHLYFGPNFVFVWTALGRFSQCCFLIFCRQPIMMADIFTQPLPHHKKASYGPRLPIFAKLISVGFLPPTLMSLVFQTPALKPFNRKKNSNLKRLWAITGILQWFSLTFRLQKLCEYLII